MERKDQLLQKIENRQAKIGVVGLGYVGLPLDVAFAQAGFTVQHQELLHKEMEFAPWAARMQVSREDTIRLKAMLVQAPTAVSDFLTPQISNDRITFRLTELLVVGKLS